jgi:hypothetical protein
MLEVQGRASVREDILQLQLADTYRYIEHYAAVNFITLQHA